MISPDIAVAGIVEDDGDDPDVFLHGGRKFLNSEHEATIAQDGKDRFVGIGHLDTERCRVAEAERALVTASDIGAWIVGLPAEITGVDNLAEVIDEQAIARKFVTQNGEILHLRLHGVDAVMHGCTCFPDKLGGTGFGFCVGEFSKQCVGDVVGIGDDGDMRFERRISAGSMSMRMTCGGASARRIMRCMPVQRMY